MAPLFASLRSAVPFASAVAGNSSDSSRQVAPILGAVVGGGVAVAAVGIVLLIRSHPADIVFELKPTATTSASSPPFTFGLTPTGLGGTF